MVALREVTGGLVSVDVAQASVLLLTSRIVGRQPRTPLVPCIGKMGTRAAIFRAGTGGQYNNDKN